MERNAIRIIWTDRKKNLIRNTGNSFLGSSETLIKGDVIKKIRENFKKHINGQDIQLHKDFTTTVIKIYEPPYKNHAYVIGADPAMGTESDYHAMCVWDITNTFDIKQVARFYQNDIPPKIFAYIFDKGFENPLSL